MLTIHARLLLLGRGCFVCSMPGCRFVLTPLFGSSLQALNSPGISQAVFPGLFFTRLFFFLGDQHIAPVVHLGFDEFCVIAFQFQFQVAFFEFENVFAHGAFCPLLIS
jgi:hypothetical protein